MTPTNPAILEEEYMQLDAALENQSHIRLIAYQDQTEDKPERSQSSTQIELGQENPSITKSEFRSSRPRHQRLQTLTLSARQVIEQGGRPGLTNPYLPRGPSLYREIIEDQFLAYSRRPSPLRDLAYNHFTPNPEIRYASDFRPSANMPHAVTAQTGFQALILCGPGIGLNTFTSVPNDYPKALIPIANRPMIWYALDFCYRMGVTDITIVTPPASKAPIAAALAQNPYLTSLPSPSPNLLAPAKLEFNTPTAELLRLPEIQSTIKTDFIILPCDLVCDIPVEALLETYLLSQSSFAGVNTSYSDTIKPAARSTSTPFALGAEASGRHGALSIWYNTAAREESVPKEECDFMSTVPLHPHHNPAISLSHITHLPSEGQLRKLVWTMPMSELIEQAEEDKSWNIRQSLLQRYGSVKCLTKYRDSHIYFFPRWIKDFAMLNEDFESISEDLVGTWAKCEWRKASYRARHHTDKIFQQPRSSARTDTDARNPDPRPIEDEIDLLSLSSSQISQHTPLASPNPAARSFQLASRVQPLSTNLEDSIISTTTDSQPTTPSANTDPANLLPHLPPVLAYILPSTPSAPLVRRVDSTALLLSTSLLLAKLPSLEDGSSSPFAHPSKIHPTVAVPAKSSINRADTLVGPNTTLALHTMVKASCIASNCTIGQGARITNSLIMDGAVVGERATLHGCVVGKKAVIGAGVSLRECEVQDGMVIKDGTEGKGEKYLIGGFEDGEFGSDNDEEGDDDDDTV